MSNLPKPPGKTPPPEGPSPASPSEAYTTSFLQGRKRRPISGTERRLQVDPIPGYHLYFFLEKNVPRALEAGYEYVDTSQDNVVLNRASVGTDSEISGNLDLGTRVRAFGGLGADNQPEYHVLMKIREEWWEEDQSRKNSEDARRVDMIFRQERVLGTEKVSEDDKEKMYVKRELTKASFMNKLKMNYKQ